MITRTLTALVKKVVQEYPHLEITGRYKKESDLIYFYVSHPNRPDKLVVELETWNPETKKVTHWLQKGRKQVSFKEVYGICPTTELDRAIDSIVVKEGFLWL